MDSRVKGVKTFVRDQDGVNQNGFKLEQKMDLQQNGN